MWWTGLVTIQMMVHGMGSVWVFDGLVDTVYGLFLWLLLRLA